MLVQAQSTCLPTHCAWEAGARLKGNLSKVALRTAVLVVWDGLEYFDASQLSELMKDEAFST